MQIIVSNFDSVLARIQKMEMTRNHLYGWSDVVLLEKGAGVYSYFWIFLLLFLIGIVTSKGHHRIDSPWTLNFLLGLKVDKGNREPLMGNTLSWESRLVSEVPVNKPLAQKNTNTWRWLEVWVGDVGINRKHIVVLKVAYKQFLQFTVVVTNVWYCFKS